VSNGRDVGVNPGGAMRSGIEVVLAGQQFGQLQRMLQQAVLEAQHAAVEPECVNGYPAFLDDGCETITGIVQHTVSIGQRVQEGGMLAAQTDWLNAVGIGGAHSALGRPINSDI
jgi:hypothetical protein